MAAHEEQLCRLALHDEAFIETILAVNLNTLPDDDEAPAEPQDPRPGPPGGPARPGAAPVSYQWNVGAALDAGATTDEILGTMIAVAPIISGIARVVQATPDVALPIGYDLDVAFEELDPDPPA